MNDDQSDLTTTSPPPLARGDNAEIASVSPCVAPSQPWSHRRLNSSIYHITSPIAPPRLLFLVTHSKQGDRPKLSMAGGGHFRESRMKRSTVCGSADLVSVEPVRVCLSLPTDDRVEPRFADPNSWTRHLNDGTSWCVLD